MSWLVAAAMAGNTKVGEAGFSLLVHDSCPERTCAIKQLYTDMVAGSIGFGACVTGGAGVMLYYAWNKFVVLLLFVRDRRR